MIEHKFYDVTKKAVKICIFNLYKEKLVKSMKLCLPTPSPTPLPTYGTPAPTYVPPSGTATPEETYYPTSSGGGKD